MYIVVDYYENPFGQALFVTYDYSEAVKFCNEFEEECDFECKLTIKKEIIF